MINLTIGITTFSRTKYLNECINSVLIQNNKNIQIVISNDNPKRKLSLKNLNLKNKKNIKIFNQKKNLGPVENKNFLLSKVKTPWFSWLSDDDKLEQNFYEKLSKIYLTTKNKNKIAGIYSNFYDNNPTKPFKSSTQIFRRKDFIEKYSSGKIKLVGIYGLLRSKSLKKMKGVKKLSSPFSPYCDNLLPLELSKLGNIIYTNEKLCRFRIHKNSQSNSNTPLKIWFIAQSNYIKSLNKILKSDDDVFKKKILRNTLNYFTKNIVDLIKRNKKKLLSNLFNFYCYQIKYAYKDVNFYFWPLILMNNIKIIKRLVLK